MTPDIHKSLDSKILRVQDFPKPGIKFYDINPVLRSPHEFDLAIKEMKHLSEKFKGITKVIGIEARGFVFASIMARELHAGFVPVRKPGKLPGTAYGLRYECEYGEGSLEIQADAISNGDKVLVVDDVLATGGTLQTATKLLTGMVTDSRDIHVICFIEIEGLGGRHKLNPQIKVDSVLRY